MLARKPDIVPPCRRRPDLHVCSARSCDAAPGLTITAPRPALDAAIEIRPGTDIEDVWSRFEVFEALHHTMQICNPLTSAELDQVIDALPLVEDCHVVDFACGYGEAVLRAAARAQIYGTGVDLSPWMVAQAAKQAEARAPDARLQWVLGEARDYLPARPTDVAVCIGAEWVWHDFGGTARALAGHLSAGGVAVVGAARLHAAADADQVRRTRGVVETIDDQRVLLDQHGLEPLHRIDPDDAGWDAYLDRTAQAARMWAGRFPGPASDTWLAEQADWQAARERDRDVIGWSVWLARRAHTISSPIRS